MNRCCWARASAFPEASASSPSSRRGLERRQQAQAPAGAVEVPRAAVGQVVVEVVGLVLLDDPDVGQPAVGHVRQGDVDEAEHAGEGHRRLRPPLGQRAEPAAGAAGEHDDEDTGGAGEHGHARRPYPSGVPARNLGRAARVARQPLGEGRSTVWPMSSAAAPRRPHMVTTFTSLRTSPYGTDQDRAVGMFTALGFETVFDAELQEGFGGSSSASPAPTITSHWCGRVTSCRRGSTRHPLRHRRRSCRTRDRAGPRPRRRGAARLGVRPLMFSSQTTTGTASTSPRPAEQGRPGQGDRGDAPARRQEASMRRCRAGVQ